MYEYILVTIHNDLEQDTNITKITKDLCYFKNYCSDYLLMNEESIIIKPFNNPIFSNKKNHYFKYDGSDKYDYFNIIIEEKIEDVNLIEYLTDMENNYMIIDQNDQIIKSFNLECSKVKTLQ